LATEAHTTDDVEQEPGPAVALQGAMASAIEWQDGSFTRLDEDDPWPEEPTAVIPTEDLQRLRDVMDQSDGTVTQRMEPVPELLAVGSMTELSEVAVYDQVVTFRRASGRSVTVAPEAERTRAWVIGLFVVLLVVEILALAW
jgi:hypothetical protein